MRVFIYDNREFPDPSPDMNVDEVRSTLAEFFGELASGAEVKESTRGEDTLYEFTRRVGTKG